MGPFPSQSLDTLCIHAGQEPDLATGAVMMPIVLATTFAQDGPGATKGYDYSRAGNPTRNALEQCLASLEGGKHGIAFGSGCAATTAVLLTLRAGDHVLVCDDVYGGTFRILDKVLAQFGLEATFLDITDPKRVESAMRPTTRLVWVETPSNPMLKIFDIGAIGAIAKAHDAILAVDNTFATPMLQRPLDLGATLAVHSTTKYLNGHSDVIGGAVITNDDALAEKLHFVQKAVGAVPSPFDCYLVLRGLKTLAVRMERHVASARTLAAWLEAHPQVAKVRYPGLAGHEGPRSRRATDASAGWNDQLRMPGYGRPSERVFARASGLRVCRKSRGRRVLGRAPRKHDRTRASPRRPGKPWESAMD